MIKDVRSRVAFPWLRLPVTVLAIAAVLLNSVPAAFACCPAGPQGIPVLNADQAVIILWDKAAQTQHFIRMASFASEAEDFGFLIPSPSRPDLSESGEETFPFLADLTKPEIQLKAQHVAPFGCSMKDEAMPTAMAPVSVGVEVLEEKLVAGFKAAVLAADSARALVDWLKQNGYAFSPEVEAWAKPYVETGWLITALKVAKGADKARTTASAPSLRMSFKTDRPLFPYREPDSKGAADKLNPYGRVLRIFFIGEARYQGGFDGPAKWSGNVAWSGKLGAQDRDLALDLLKLPASTGPKEFWLTEFEDRWQYANAPGDVYFSLSPDQSLVRRPPHIRYYQVTWPFYAVGAALILAPLGIARWLRRRN
jgi:hypothetical protein